ncbi:hypothetical protein [Marivirga sp.]|uniref:hypothetical protein n=1 Tax=Marivirga sp. TaxID=2018662 RepID=UPI003DA7A11A
MKKLILFIILLITYACTLESIPRKQYAYNLKEDLISNQDRIQLVDSGAILSNIVTSYQLDNKRLYVVAQQTPEVSAYDLEDASYQSFQYQKRPVKINEFDLGHDKLMMFSALSKAIFVLDKTNGTVLNEINLDPQKYEIESRLGESLFHLNEKDSLFYVGLKDDDNTKAIELVGAFDFSGKLQFTFGDFTQDNDASKPGYLLSNAGVLSQLTKKSLYVLKKETSRLYQFDLSGNLLHKEMLSFEKIPKHEKVKMKGKSVIKDQIMDFKVDESNQTMVYTYFTDTGEFMGEKLPAMYLAFKEVQSDSISIKEVNFFKLIDYQEQTISTIPIDRNSEEKYFTRFNIHEVSNK